MKLLGVDTGGTFTDFVYYDGKSVRTHKTPSTPGAPEQAILQGIHDLGIKLSDDLQIVHGSTVATNAVLEGKGAYTVYICNRGFKDVLTIGRQARKDLYNLTPAPINPPVPASHCLETGGRINARGEVLDPLTKDDLSQLLQKLNDLKPEAVAINLLFSYLDSSFEEQVAAAIPDSIFFSCSSKILPVYREYERGITTWLNAYVGPVMQGYLSRIKEQSGHARFSIMRSSGNTCDMQQAGKEAVNLLLSGPAGGLTAAHYLANEFENNQVLTFDMGGTSTDVALMDGQIELTGEGKIADYPVGVPMVNIHTIGAGGGSIAYIDEGGLLQVGPESAGATPGPACYGKGGQAATVTDANLLLGRIPNTIRFGESISVDMDKAQTAIATLTRQSGLSSDFETAKGIIRIANEHMAQALRVISVERGVDPRGFSLMAFGGAGGLHVCELAEQLGMAQAIVPSQAGVLSALGMLVAKPGRQLTRTLGRLINDVTQAEIETAIKQLQQQAKQALAAEGHALDNLSFQVSLDLCYRGQASTLSVPFTDTTDAEIAFSKLHEQRYGYKLKTPVEIVNVNIGASIEQAVPKFKVSARAASALQEANDYFHRNNLKPGQLIEGEAIICDSESTTWVAPNWVAEADSHGHILLKKT